MAVERRQESIDENLLKDEYEFGVGYGLRWFLYEYADDGLDFHAACADALELEGKEAILDIGCGHGGFLGLIAKRKHEGQLVGTDYTSSLAYSSKSGGRISYFRSDASVGQAQGLRPRHLPVSDGAFDIATALFMLYHVEDPKQTIRDMSRIVKRGGKVAVATSGPTNKQEHRKIEAKIAHSLGVEPPPLYAKPFTTEIAEEVLPEIFEDAPAVLRQTTTVTITREHIEDFTQNGTYNVLRVYLDSIKSMNRHFGSAEHRPRGLYSEIATIALQHITTQIEQSGQFQDTIDRAFYVAKNVPA